MRWIFTLFFMCSWVSAQDAAVPDVTATPSALEQLQATHQASMADLDAPMTAWNERYVVELNKLKAQAQSAGDLNQVLLIGQEIDLVAEDRSQTIDPKYTALKRLRGIYDQRSAVINKAHQTRLRTALGEHRRALVALQGQLTQAGKIDEALEVRDAVTHLESEMQAVAAAVRAGRPARPARVVGNRRPGRLMIFGTNADAERMTIPEEMQNKPFVRVSATYNEWYAITPDGKLICGSHDRNDLKVPEGMEQPVVEHVGGRHMGFAMHADGTFTPIAGADHAGTIPEGLSKVRSISCGHSLNVAVLPNGRAVPFGYHLRGASKYINSRNILNDVVKSACASGQIYLLKRDGTVVSSQLTGEAVKDFPEWSDIVDIQVAVSSHGVVAQKKDGTLVEKFTHDVPADFGAVRQYRVGYSLVAGQREDGSWEVFGSEPLATNVNRFLEQTGPLRDLSLGSSYLVGIK